MKKCTWCGEEYPDYAMSCEIDQMPLATSKSTSSSSPKASGERRFPRLIFKLKEGPLPTRSQLWIQLPIWIAAALFFLGCATFLSFDHIKVCGEIIQDTDPRFPFWMTVWRLCFGVGGVIGAFGAFTTCRALRRKPKNCATETVRKHSI